MCGHPLNDDPFEFYDALMYERCFCGGVTYYLNLVLIFFIFHFADVLCYSVDVNFALIHVLYPLV
jgi:hypothetical protein